MKNQIKMSVLMLAVFAPVFMNAQDVHWAQADDSLALELIAMEKMWAESNCMDQPGLENVFADEFQGTSPFGIYYGKKEAIATDWNNLRKECKLGDVKIRFFGKHWLLLTVQRAAYLRILMVKKLNGARYGLIPG